MDQFCLMLNFCEEMLQTRLLLLTN